MNLVFVNLLIRALTGALTNALSKIDALAAKVDAFEEKFASPEEKKADLDEPQASSVTGVSSIVVSRGLY